MRTCLGVGTALLVALTGCQTATTAPTQSALSNLPKLGQVSDRYQSYNVEMVEVTGGRFWAPYGGPAGEVYRERPPIDLKNERLRQLARHLAPAMMRVSGTWANNTYLAAESENLSAPPAGYKQVLKPEQWRSVVEFSKAVDAPIVTSFAVSSGTRTADGAWQTDQAQRLVDVTTAAGGSLYAAEFFNEPNVPSATIGMPKGYNAETYGNEFRQFRKWARKSVPEMKILGPGGVGEGSLTKDIPVNRLTDGFVRSEDMMKANPGSVDAVSYHFYGSLSQRCEAMKIGTAAKEDALKPQWLDRTALDLTYYAKLRDRFEPGKPIWNTETAQAACGGSPWAATFLDSFRYLNQLGLLAQKNVQVVMHNTLAASDYALIDQDTLEPRPNYWAAVLWRKLMGPTVLASPTSPAANLRLYAHCLPEKKGGVGILALNIGTEPLAYQIGQAAKIWLMAATPLDSKSVLVNGNAPSLNNDGNINGLQGAASAGSLSMPGQTIAFIAVQDANNSACK